MSALAYGRVDREGRLVEAEPALQQLQESAGSFVGHPVAVPQIATIARLAQRLGVLVSRCVIAAEGADDLDLWVEAKPDDRGVNLSVGGWSRRSARGVGDGGGERVLDFAHPHGDWLWEADAALRVKLLSGPGDDSAVGQSLTRLFQFVDSPDAGLPILEAMAARARFDGQDGVIRATGERVRLSGVPLIDGGGRFAGYRGSVFRLNGVPEPAPLSVDPFGARLEQALRGPLARIVDQAETIGAQHDGPLRREYADYALDIANAGKHLLGLVGDLVDLQAIESEAFKPRAERIDLADLARRAAGLLRVRAAQRAITIDTPAAHESAPALGDEGRAVQILVNLVGNAVRHSPPQAPVQLRSGSRDGWTTIEVTDQGGGIEADHQQRIFEKFARIGPSDGPGSGLGLYIARRLARAMGGDIAVDSARGQGARFMLRLPAA